MDAEIRLLPYGDETVQRLVQEMADDLAVLYGPASYPPQDPSKWAPPDGVMLVVYVAGEAVGCGGLIRHDARSAELKRMFVRAGHRRRGRGRLILTALLAEAARLGYERVVLETGVPQEAARQLYLAEGFQEVRCWPPHESDPTSVCYARSLVTAT